MRYRLYLNASDKCMVTQLLSKRRCQLTCIDAFGGICELLRNLGMGNTEDASSCASRSFLPTFLTATLGVRRRGLWAIGKELTIEGGGRGAMYKGWRMILRIWSLGGYCYYTILVHLVRKDIIFVLNLKNKNNDGRAV